MKIFSENLDKGVAEFPESSDEIGIQTDINFFYKYRKITKTLAEKFNIPEYDINQLVYAETCMANCWNVESGLESDMKQVKFAEVKMKAFDRIDLSELDELDKIIENLSA